MAVEAVYPISEAVATCILTLLNNVGCCVFLLVQNLPNIGTAWMNWAIAGACAAALVVIVPLAEVRKRFAVDMGADEGEGSAGSGEPVNALVAPPTTSGTDCMLSGQDCPSLA
jgi:hypothetical protein